MNTDEVVSQMTQMAVFYGPKLIGAILVWIIGGWVIGIIGNVFKTTLKKGGTDPSLMPFLTGIVNGLLKVLLVLTALGMLGIEMTSFIAILGAAGLAVMILIFKPFKVGYVIDAQGYVGTVSQIQIFNTILKTPDNKTIIIPNGGLSTSSMVNYSTEAKRRVDWTIGVGYGDDLDKAREVIKRLCDEDERILKDPEVFIAVSALADSSVNFAVRAWVNAPDYWGVYFQMNEKVYKTFANEGLNIPFPQMDVHIHKDA